jgi:AraC-like DNA-binding protein
VEDIRKLLPTVTGFAAQQAIGVLRKHKVAVAPLLHRAGIPEYALPTSDGEPAHLRISAAGQGKFLDYAADAMGDSAFGLHLAAVADPRDAGILFYVASSAQTLGEALALFARYFRVVNEAVRLKLTKRPGGVAAEVQFIGLPRHELRQNAEFGMAVILKALRELARRNIRPTRAAFVHPRNSDLREFRRFYLCPVEFGLAASAAGATDLLEFANETLAIPLVTADVKLLKALRPFCDAARDERNTPTNTLRVAVENEVERLLPHGKANKDIVAKVLGLSTRTLLRRLADERVTFEEVVDQLRHSLARQYLKDSNLSFSQMAWLLGYEGSASLNHACRRWMGRSPSQARKEMLLGENS